MLTAEGQGWTQTFGYTTQFPSHVTGEQISNVELS